MVFNCFQTCFLICFKLYDFEINEKSAVNKCKTSILFFNNIIRTNFKLAVAAFSPKTSNVSAMSIEEMKKELTIDPKETNGNNEMCLYSLKEIQIL